MLNMCRCGVMGEQLPDFVYRPGLCPMGSLKTYELAKSRISVVTSWIALGLCQINWLRKGWKLVNF